MAALRGKQGRFVDEYLVDCNGTQAAIRAGYSPRTARQMATENLSKPAIADAIAARQSELAEKTGITQEYVLQTIRETVERCLQHEPVLDNLGEPTGEYVFREGGVLKGCELLGRYLGVFERDNKQKTPSSFQLVLAPQPDGDD